MDNFLGLYSFMYFFLGIKNCAITSDQSDVNNLQKAFAGVWKLFGRSSTSYRV